MSESESENFHIERSVAGNILLFPDALDRVVDLLPSDFEVMAHRAIIEAVLMLRQRHEAVDVVTVSNALREMRRLEAIGGFQFLLELTEGIVAGTANLETHAKFLRASAARRRMTASIDIAKARIVSGEQTDKVWADLSRSVNVEQARGETSYHIGADIDPLFASIERRLNGEEKPLPTPWRGVSDALGGGLWPGMYILVGGTGTGKTQWAIQASLEAARFGNRVLYIALELGEQELCARFIGAAAGVKWSQFLRGRIAPDTRIVEAANLIHSLPIFRECGAPMDYTSDTLMSRAWSMRPNMIVIDFLQLCFPKASEDLRLAIARMAYAARQIAREMNCVVLALSSTGRQNYNALTYDPAKSEPRDMIGFGKETGELEYASDNVLVLANHQDKNTRNRKYFVIAKQRAGMETFVELEWTGTSYNEIERELEPQPEPARVPDPRAGPDDADEPF